MFRKIDGFNGLEEEVSQVAVESADGQHVVESDARAEVLAIRHERDGIAREAIVVHRRKYAQSRVAVANRETSLGQERDLLRMGSKRL